MKKIMRNIVITIVITLILILVGIGVMFNKEIASILSIKKHDDYGFYEMNVTSDYALDDLIADGGAKTDAELTSYLIDKILKGLPIEFDVPNFGCATFLAHTIEGDVLFGRNYDLTPVPSMLVRTTPENGYASVSIANADVLGFKVGEEPTIMQKAMALASPYVLMDGMNEKGLSIGVLLIADEPTKQDTDKPDMTTTAMMRVVLDKAASVDEAIELFNSYDMNASAGASYHFQVVDASGDSAVIEYIDNEIEVIKKEEGKNQALTNFLISPKKANFGKGQDRYKTIMTTLDEKEGILSEEEAMDLLSKVYQSDPDAKDSTSNTQWSVVYNNTDLTLDISINGNYEQVYSFSLFK